MRDDDLAGVRQREGDVELVPGQGLQIAERRRPGPVSPEASHVLRQERAAGLLGFGDQARALALGQGRLAVDQRAGALELPLAEQLFLLGGRRGLLGEAEPGARPVLVGQVRVGRAVDVGLLDAQSPRFGSWMIRVSLSMAPVSSDSSFDSASLQAWTASM
jgi:hypothetical protein